VSIFCEVVGLSIGYAILELSANRTASSRLARNTDVARNP